jgi:hypothetical protein
MKLSRICLGAASLALASLLPSPALSDPPASSASGSAKAPARPPAPVPFESLAIPGEKSERPTLAEWRQAQRVEVARRSFAASSCGVYVVREWLKVHCRSDIAGIRQYAGSPDGVLTYVRQRADGEMTFIPIFGEVVMPMRVGDRRMIQFFSGQAGGYGISSDPSMVVHETWLEGEERPTVVLR